MKNIRWLLLIVFFMSSMTACQPAVKEFEPNKDSLFKITFSYPENWVWQQELPFDEIAPGEELPPSELIVLQEGSTSIQVFMPSNPQDLMQYWMDSYVNAVGSWLRSDTIIKIDGYEARQLTVVTPQSVGEPSFSESVYLNTGDRFYVISFDVRESESDGRLHRQFEGLVKSIKVLP